MYISHPTWKVLSKCCSPPLSKQTRERAVNTSACAEMHEEATRYVYTLLYCQNKGDGSLLKTTYIFKVSIHHL